MTDTMLVIDMQGCFLFDVSKPKKLIQNQIRVIDYCIEKDIPTILIEYRFFGDPKNKLYHTIRSIKKKVAKVPRHFKSFKRNEDAFSNQELVILLKELGTTRVCLMGVYSSFCVHSTANSAKKGGLEIITSQDVMSDSERMSNIDGMREYASLWYKQNSTLCKDYRELIEQMRQ